MEAINKYPFDFFSQADLTTLQKAAGHKKNKDIPEHQNTYDYLAKTYLKVEYWAQQVQKTLFDAGYIQIFKKPTNQANYFTEYLWAKIYPAENSPVELAFTIELNADAGFILKIDTVGLDDNTPIRQLYLKYRGEWLNSAIVKFISYEELEEFSWDYLIKSTCAYFSQILADYVNLVKEISNLDSSLVSELINEIDVKKAKDFKNEVNSEDRTQNANVYLPPNTFVLKEGKRGVIGVKKLAKIMAELLRGLQDDKGKMVGIFGNWGRGKTFLFEKIWEELNADSNNTFIKIEFHAWKYQDTPASWAYLYEAFAKNYFEDEVHKNRVQNYFLKTKKQIQLNYERIGLKPILVFIASFIAALLAYKFTKSFSQGIRFTALFGGLGFSIFKLLEITKNTFSKEAKDLFKKYYQGVSFQNLLGVQAEIQKELKSLLSVWFKNKNDNRKILLFVDDIDRCKEEKIIEIIDALRVLLDDDQISKRVIVIAAIDERVLKRVIKWKYHDLITKDYSIKTEERDFLSLNLANEYMDKLFLAGVKLGALTLKEKQEILTKTIDGKVLRKKITSTNESNKENANEAETDLINNEQDNRSSKNENTSTVIDLRTGSFEISDEEETELMNTISQSNEMTPRQIRIFYYRYLLGRSILLSKLKQNDLLHKNQLEILARLLMQYTIQKNSNFVTMNKMGVTTDSEGFVNQMILGQEFKLTKQEHLLYHDVLETIIAY